MRLPVPIFLAAAMLSACASPGLKAFPELKRRDPLVAVVDLAPGAWLPRVKSKPSDCPSLKDGKAVQCVRIDLDPPPFWLSVTKRLVVFGAENTPRSFAAATSNHWGMRKNYEGPFLATFVTDGEHYVFRRNAFYPLVRKADGSLYLPVWTHQMPYLPCGVLAIKEELQPDEVSPRLQAWSDDTLALKEHAELFRKTADGYFSKYGIPMTKLKQYLAENPPPEDGWGCNK
jgi:hypothetical protein